MPNPRDPLRTAIRGPRRLLVGGAIALVVIALIVVGRYVFAGGATPKLSAQRDRYKADITGNGGQLAGYVSPPAPRRGRPSA